MPAALQIRGSGHSFAILRGTRVLALATSHGNAIARLPGIERQAQARPRRCLCCQAEFQSAGAGNRLCNPCRGAA
jgi:hypothetical protein